MRSWARPRHRPLIGRCSRFPGCTERRPGLETASRSFYRVNRSRWHQRSLIIGAVVGILACLVVSTVAPAGGGTSRAQSASTSVVTSTGPSGCSVIEGASPAMLNNSSTWFGHLLWAVCGTTEFTVAMQSRSFQNFSVEVQTQRSGTATVYFAFDWVDNCSGSSALCAYTESWKGNATTGQVTGPIIQENALTYESPDPIGPSISSGAGAIAVYSVIAGVVGIAVGVLLVHRPRGPGRYQAPSRATPGESEPAAGSMKSGGELGKSP